MLCVAGGEQKKEEKMKRENIYNIENVWVCD